MTANAPVLERAAPAIEQAAQTAVRSAHEETLPTPVALARGRAASAVAALGFAGFLAIFGLVRTHRSEAFDLALTLKVQSRRHAVLERVMAAASWLGFPPQSRIVPPAIIGTLYAFRFPTEARFQLLAWCTGLVSTVLKAIMRRPRPVAGTDLRVVAAPLGGSSFPSGHVITYVGTYGFLAYLAHTLIRPRGVRRALVAGLVGLLALVGPSRIHQGHHWPTDVTASYLLGTSYLIGLTALYRRAKERRAARLRRGDLARSLAGA
ncbi:MAG TPA: phosphatase PAP2 family protein [Candidatus Limnocylindrales bacterium]|nr:phosphatase PAP2 family protein [Candidatus Limnocylindrales bacterium]